MVLCGGLELVVGAYIVHEHQKHKKERKRLEEEVESKKNHEKRRRRRHSSSPSRPRPTKPHKYGYTSGPATGAGKPVAAVAGLYAQQSPPPAYYSPNQNYDHKPALPQPPQHQVGPNSAPSQWGPPPPSAPPFAFSLPPQRQPQAMNHPQNSQYYTPPLLYSSDHPSQAPNHQSHNQGPPYPDHTGGVYGAGGDWHSRSDTSLPLGIYEPSEEPYAGPYEMSADGPWMQDAHRTAHQRPHVRIRLPNDAVVQPGVDSARSPPPAYQAYRPW